MRETKKIHRLTNATVLSVSLAWAERLLHVSHTPIVRLLVSERDDARNTGHHFICIMTHTRKSSLNWWPVSPAGISPSQSLYRKPWTKAPTWLEYPLIGTEGQGFTRSRPFPFGQWHEKNTCRQQWGGGRGMQTSVNNAGRDRFWPQRARKWVSGTTSPGKTFTSLSIVPWNAIPIHTNTMDRMASSGQPVTAG